MNTTTTILFSKLDEFIHKYYKNNILKGTILSFLFLLSYFISLSILEYFSYFSILVRQILFYFSIVIFSTTIIYYILFPLLHLYHIGKVLNYKDAVEIISKHFPEIQDKLKNTLELIDLEQNEENSLVIASINQRIASLSPLPFTLAINRKKNYKYLKILGLFLAVFIPSYLLYPRLFTDGATRILKHDTFFEKQLPFTFELLNSNCRIEKGSDFTFIVKISGEYIPSNVEISIGSTSYFMQKIAPTKFVFTLKGVNNSLNFHFIADEYFSKDFNLQVLPLPQIISFTLNTQVPGYTNEKNSSLTNIGDITVPEGSVLKWTFDAIDANSIVIKFNDSLSITSNYINNQFKAEKLALKSSRYVIYSSNKFFPLKRLLSYVITVIPDVSPAIILEDKCDSLKMFLHYFSGTIKDDYGFSKMQFVLYNKTNPDSTSIIPIQISKSSANQDFYYVFDFSSFSAGDEIKYYFEIFDNDGIKGPKSTKSTLFTLKIPTAKEVEKMDAQMTRSLESDMMKSMQVARDLKKEIENTKKKLLNENITMWEKSQLMKQLDQKQEQLMQLVNSVKEQNNKKNSISDFTKNRDKDIVEKQKQIEDLMNNLMDDEFKKMLDEYKNLMNNFNKDKFFEKTDDIKLSLEDLEKQLDKNLELLKRMDIEKNIKNTISDLKTLEKEQNKVLNDIDNKNETSSNIFKQQDELNKNIDDLEKKYNDIVNNNEDLDHKMNLNDFNKEFNDLKKSMNESSQQMTSGSKSKSKKQMQQSQKMMQNLEQSMASMLQKNQKEQNSEDESQLRQILDNLLTLSFKQEALQKNIKNLVLSDPKFVFYLKSQQDLIENFVIIKDSLYSLAKRQSAIKKTVTDQIKDIERSFNKIKYSFDDRNMSSIAVNQQLVMTSLNNLALLFAEILKNMQNQSQQMSSSQGSCNNPKNKGKGSTSLSEMKSSQQSMKQQLQQMINQMKDGQGKKGLSKQISQMLADQEKYQQSLNEMIKDGGFSPDATKKLNDIKQLIDENHKDIINQNISPQTMFRQNQILTRLLEAENADNQRDKDTKRESNQAKNELYSNPIKFLKYKQITNTNKELLKYENVKLQSYFKKKYELYLLHFTPQ